MNHPELWANSPVNRILLTIPLEIHADRAEQTADTVQSRAELRLLASCASRHNASNACIVLVDTIHAFHSNNILLVPSSKSQIRPRIRMEAKGTDDHVNQSCHGGSLSESIMGFDSPSHPYLHCLLPIRERKKKCSTFQKRKCYTISNCSVLRRLHGYA